MFNSHHGKLKAQFKQTVHDQDLKILKSYIDLWISMEQILMYITIEGRKRKQYQLVVNRDDGYI